MTRALALAYLRIAGYHGDRAAFTRLYVEERAGDARAKAAIEHLRTAREALNAACRDLCSVAGAAYHYREISKLADGCQREIREIDLDCARTPGAGKPFVLNHEPTDEEIDNPHACSLEVLS